MYIAILDEVHIAGAIAAALSESFNMAWDVLWPLILGFTLSGAVQAVVSHKSMAMLLGDDSPRSLTLATLFGAASTATSHYFVSDWASVWMDVVGGLLIAGALAAWVPASFWRAFFLVDNPTMAAIEGPLVGPLVALLSFVCSVGNVPLAAVLWQGGISFGGVASFIFADLIILPILDIYRKYYSGRVALYILATFYVTMALAGYIVEFIFGVVDTAVLNVVFTGLAALQPPM